MIRPTLRTTYDTPEIVHPCIRASVHPCIRASVHPCIRASVHPCIRASVQSALHVDMSRCGLMCRILRLVDRAAGTRSLFVKGSALVRRRRTVRDRPPLAHECRRAVLQPGSIARSDGRTVEMLRFHSRRRPTVGTARARPNRRAGGGWGRRAQRRPLRNVEATRGVRALRPARPRGVGVPCEGGRPHLALRVLPGRGGSAVPVCVRFDQRRICQYCPPWFHLPWSR
jgi:hypothetical protein